MTTTEKIPTELEWLLRDAQRLADSMAERTAEVAEVLAEHGPKTTIVNVQRMRERLAATWDAVCGCWAMVSSTLNVDEPEEA